MKKLVITLILCSFFATSSVFAQQWNGSTTIHGDINRSGRVGLGVTSPYARLDIKSTDASTGGPAILYPHLRLHTELTAPISATYVWDITYSNSLNFHYGTTTNNLSRVLSLSTTKFDYVGNRLQIGTGEKRFNLGQMNAPNGNPGHYLAFGANPSAGVWNFTGNSNNNGGAIIHSDNQGNLFFITRTTSASNFMSLTETNANTRIFVNTLGDVGIGTTNPEKKLHIANGEVLIENGRLVISDGTDNQLELKSDGLIHAREIEVDLILIPDYVFEDDYNLMPLAELQKFIDLNHHLPNIKSAAEYEVHGSMALKELNIKLLENVEELTLYTLEQEAEIEKLKKQMKAMQLLLEKMINK